MNRDILLNSIDAAIKEDLGEEGDVTTDNILKDEEVCFVISAREELVVCGIPILREIFDRYRGVIDYDIHKQDGNFVAKDTTIVSGTAIASYLLRLERVVLNFLQHASGVASFTREFVNEIKGLKAKIRSTRKTTPGLRFLEIYAVKVGGGESYRSSLYDGVLIKDNHIASCGGITQAITKLLSNLENKFLAIECDSISQVEEALSQKIDLILLDNMSIEDLDKAVKLVNNRVLLEASGGVNLNNVRAIAETGVNYISVGALTHSFSNKDIGLDIAYVEQKKFF